MDWTDFWTKTKRQIIWNLNYKQVVPRGVTLNYKQVVPRGVIVAKCVLIDSYIRVYFMNALLGWLCKFFWANFHLDIFHNKYCACVNVNVPNSKHTIRRERVGCWCLNFLVFFVTKNGAIFV